MISISSSFAGTLVLNDEQASSLEPDNVRVSNSAQARLSLHRYESLGLSCLIYGEDALMITVRGRSSDFDGWDTEPVSALLTRRTAPESSRQLLYLNVGGRGACIFHSLIVNTT